MAKAQASGYGAYFHNILNPLSFYVSSLPNSSKQHQQHSTRNPLPPGICLENETALQFSFPPNGTVIAKPSTSNEIVVVENEPTNTTYAICSPRCDSEDEVIEEDGFTTKCIKFEEDLSRRLVMCDKKDDRYSCKDTSIPCVYNLNLMRVSSSSSVLLSNRRKRKRKSWMYELLFLNTRHI